MNDDYAACFQRGLDYTAFLDCYGSPADRDRWAAVYEQFHPAEAHRQVLGGFVRELNILCLAGAWCGDCVIQCPILQRFAEAGTRVHLRFVDRDAERELAAELQICGGSRVPVVVFLSEDFYECGRYGDRTLTRYRSLARETDQINELAGIADDWLREFERIQLMLRLSPRLRAKHGD